MIHIKMQGTDYWIPERQACRKCGKEFDLMQYGFPGDPYRNVCYECTPPRYAGTSAYTGSNDLDAMDVLEGRCLRDE